MVKHEEDETTYGEKVFTVLMLLLFALVSVMLVYVLLWRGAGVMAQVEQWAQPQTHQTQARASQEDASTPSAA